MKKVILTLVSILPFTSISIAASIKLNDLSRDEKVMLILEAMEKNETSIDLRDLKNEELDNAIETLLKNGYLLDGAKIKKGSGGESAGGGFGG